MVSVTLSSKYQVVIPKPVRERLELKPGTKLEVIDIEGHVELHPFKPLKELFGFTPGVSSKGIRDKHERV